MSIDLSKQEAFDAGPKAVQQMEMKLYWKSKWCK